jgi:hypothetical protein
MVGRCAVVRSVSILSGPSGLLARRRSGAKSDAVLGEPAEQVVAVGPDEAPAGETGIVGDFSNELVSTCLRSVAVQQMS